MNHADRTEPPFVFVGGEIYAQTTGGTLCDRLLVEHLAKIRAVETRVAPIRNWPFPSKPGLGGLLANVRNSFWSFPRGAIVWIDHGDYRDVSIAAWIWRLLFGIRVVDVVYHLDFNMGTNWRRAWRRFAETSLLRASDRIVTTSQATVQQAERLGAPPGGRIMPVSRRFDPRQVEVPDRLDREAEVVKFLFVGTVEPRKGIMDALEALDRRTGSEQITFRCAGNFSATDPHYVELRKRADRLRAETTVEFLGTVSHDQLAAELRNADAFLFASHWEGYGIAVEEAFCFGLPVLAYAAGSIPEVFSKDAEEGWLVPPRDIHALSRGIDECAGGKVERLRRGSAARQRALELVQPFDWLAFLGDTMCRIA